MSNINELKDILYKKYNIAVNSDILEEALTHPSNSEKKSYQVLEYLGDAILLFLVTEYLYFKNPELSEGELTPIRSNYIRSETLSDISEKLELKLYLKSSLKDKQITPSISSDIFESTVAAIYISSGIDETRKFLKKTLFLENPENINHKSKLQEKIQKISSEYPEYILNSISGPEHKKIFEISVYYKKSKLGSGKGFSKRQAEQEAAKNALELKYLEDIIKKRRINENSCMC